MTSCSAMSVDRFHTILAPCPGARIVQVGRVWSSDREDLPGVYMFGLVEQIAEDPKARRLTRRIQIVKVACVFTTPPRPDPDFEGAVSAMMAWIETAIMNDRHLKAGGEPLAITTTLVRTTKSFDPNAANTVIVAMMDFEVVLSHETGRPERPIFTRS